MLTDAFLQLSSAQAVTATAVSTNTIDLSVSRDIAVGNPLYIVIAVDEAALAAGAATVNFQVISSATANLASPTVLEETGPIGKADLTLNREPLVLWLAPAFLAAQPLGQRFIGVQYTVATGPLTAGKFTAQVTYDYPQVGHFYPSGFTVA